MFKLSKVLCPNIVKGLFQFRNEQFLLLQEVLKFLALKFRKLYQMK